MRLLSIIHGPVYGGAHNQMIQLARPLRARGWETVGLVPAEGAEAAQRLRDAGIDTEVLPLHRLRATLNPVVQLRFLGHLRGEIRAIRRLIRDRDIALVQPHGPTNPHGAMAAHREGVGVVWQIYDTRAPMLVRRATMPLVVRLADAVTTWGEELARVHPGATGLGERLVTIFPPVDTKRFSPATPERRASARAKLGIGDDEFAVVSVGNLNPSKGHEFLIRGLAAARRREARICVRILGAYSPAHEAYFERLRAEAGERGLLDGALDFVDAGTRVADLLPAFEAFALTSVPRSEGMPTAILEAMACGLPVVASDVGAVRELVDDGLTGIVLTPEREEDVSRALVDLVRDADQRSRLGAAARKTAVERFSLDSCADRHLLAFETAMDHRRSRSRRAG